MIKFPSISLWKDCGSLAVNPTICAFSLSSCLSPPNQFIDRTVSRINTFFDNSCVAHVSLANPVSSQLIDLILKSKLKDIKVKKGGTYVAIEGPQFSTYAESMLYKSWKCDVIGMTNMPEARLVREAEMGYASIAMVTDYDCWHKEHENVTVQQIISTMQKNTSSAKLLLKSIFNKLNNVFYSCKDFINRSASVN